MKKGDKIQIKWINSLGKRKQDTGIFKYKLMNMIKIMQDIEPDFIIIDYIR